jgi:hypothetical protein
VPFAIPTFEIQPCSNNDLKSGKSLILNQENQVPDHENEVHNPEEQKEVHNDELKEDQGSWNFESWDSFSLKRGNSGSKGHLWHLPKRNLHSALPFGDDSPSELNEIEVKEDHILWSKAKILIGKIETLLSNLVHFEYPSRIEEDSYQRYYTGRLRTRMLFTMITNLAAVIVVLLLEIISDTFGAKRLEPLNQVLLRFILFLFLHFSAILILKKKHKSAFKLEIYALCHCLVVSMTSIALDTYVRTTMAPPPVLHVSVQGFMFFSSSVWQRFLIVSYSSG